MAQSHVGRSQVICADIPPIRFSVSRQVIHCAINLIALQLGGWATGTGGERWRGGMESRDRWNAPCVSCSMVQWLLRQAALASLASRRSALRKVTSASAGN